MENSTTSLWETAVSTGQLILEKWSQPRQIREKSYRTLPELFHVAQGKGAWLNDKPLQVSELDDITYAIIGVDWSFNSNYSGS